MRRSLTGRNLGDASACKFGDDVADLRACGFKPVARFVPAFPKNGRELVAWGRGYPRIPEASVTPASTILPVVTCVHSRVPTSM